MITLPKHIEVQLSQKAIWGRLTAPQKAHFLANCHHESNGFETTTERLNYTPIRFFQTFGTRVDTLQKAKILVQSGQRVMANYVYNGRMGNDINTNDGYDYRGRGYIQLTGKKNYLAFAIYIGDLSIMENPSIVAEKYALEVAFWYFEINKIWALATDTKTETIKKIRKKINGGYNGLQEVSNLTNQYFNLL